jgi:alkylation response protein AidB-like acyl-CoA dehydrogenase
MDDSLGSDQQVLLDASTRFMEKDYPLARVRQADFADTVVAETYWHQAAELGWCSLLVPEELGGGNVSGNGVVDAGLIAYRRGQLLQPGPFVGTNVVAYALATAGSDEQRETVLPFLISGAARGAWAITGTSGGPSMGGVAIGTVSANGYRLSGSATFVEDPGPGGWILLGVETNEGPSQALLSADELGTRVVRLDSLDLSRRFVELRLDGVELPASAVVGLPGGAANYVEQQLAIACILGAAESVGAMDREFAMTLEYAKNRIAFGRPIGSFQAIKHVLADTSLYLEMSKAIVMAAADYIGSGDGYGPAAASMAKAFVGDCGIDLAQSCFQVFGGVGFTWEHDQHLYLRRLTTDAACFGSPSWHREHLFQLSEVEELGAS